MMEDVLGAVNDFVLAYIKRGEELPALTQNQIVRGWQNLVSALPKNTREYVVLTLLATQRHGTNVHLYEVTGDSSDTLVETVARHAEHMVQVDFCCSYPDQGEEIARTRAELMEIFARDAFFVTFLRQYGLSSCYADDVKSLSFLDPETKQWVARYTVTLHLEGWTKAQPPVDSFDEVGVYLENVDVHHPVHQ